MLHPVWSSWEALSIVPRAMRADLIVYAQIVKRFNHSIQPDRFSMLDLLGTWHSRSERELHCYLEIGASA